MNHPRLLDPCPVPVLEMAAGLTIERVAKLAEIPLEEAREYRISFLRFVEQNAARFRDWKTEVDAWIEFRLEEKKNGARK